MGKTLFGGEESGTPKETREATTDLGNFFREIIQGGRALEGTGRMSSDAWMNMLGFDPATIGMGEAAQSSLMNPANRVSGLFSAMEPFEAMETERQVGGMRDIFGTMGGRFSRNVAEGETGLRRELAQGFGLNRERALLEANAQRNQAMATLLGAQTSASDIASRDRLGMLSVMSSFLQPGAPVYREGLMGGLLNLGGNMWAARQLAQGGAPPPPPPPPGQPVPSDWGRG